MREGEIVLARVGFPRRGPVSFAKSLAHAGFPRRGPSPRGLASRGPHRGPPRARARVPRRVGHAGEVVFLFHKELKIVF